MTLTQTATIARRVILGFIIFSILGLTSYIGYKIWYANYLASLPPQEEKPDTKFGVLPQMEFPPSKVPSGNFTYILDTITGGLPEFPKLIKVYFMPKAAATFLATEKGQALAQKFEINTPPQILSETKHHFQSDTRTLTVELDSGNFIYQGGATPSAGQVLDDDQKLISDFKNLLSRVGVLKSELTGNKNKIKLLKYDGNQFIDASSRNEAQAALIYLWPEDLDKLPIVTSDFNKSFVWATVLASARNLENYRSLNFTFWPVDLTTYSTYSLKPTNVAFDDLKNGKGIIVKTSEQTSGQISITSVYLAYYQAENYNPYLQPIYIFEGLEFVAYISALTNEFLSQ